MAQVAEQIALRIGHAEKHLQFKRARLQAEIFGAGQHGGNRAEIMRSEGGVERGVILQQASRETLVSRVGMRFLSEDRAGITVQPRVDNLIIPVGPLHQPDSQRRAPLLAQRQQAVDIVVGALQVALHHNAEMRPRGKFGVEGDPFEQAIGDFVEVPLLKVEVDEGQGGKFLRAQ